MKRKILLISTSISSLFITSCDKEFVDYQEFLNGKNNLNVTYFYKGDDYSLLEVNDNTVFYYDDENTIIETYQDSSILNLGNETQSLYILETTQKKLEGSIEKQNKVYSELNIDNQDTNTIFETGFIENNSYQGVHIQNYDGNLYLKSRSDLYENLHIINSTSKSIDYTVNTNTFDCDFYTSCSTSHTTYIGSRERTFEDISITNNIVNFSATAIGNEYSKLVTSFNLTNNSYTTDVILTNDKNIVYNNNNFYSYNYAGGVGEIYMGITLYNNSKQVEATGIIEGNGFARSTNNFYSISVDLTDDREGSYIDYYTIHKYNSNIVEEEHNQFASNDTYTIGTLHHTSNSTNYFKSKYNSSIKSKGTINHNLTISILDFENNEFIEDYIVYI